MPPLRSCSTFAPHPRRRVSSTLSLGALAAGFGLAWPLTGSAQEAASVGAADRQAELPTVTVRGERSDKQTYQATTSAVGKGRQALRDIPQSVTVVTEKLMDDKSQDTLKSALHGVAGIAFEAGEGGAIGDNIRLRGFPTRGDIFLDGMRDIAQYNRDTFNLDRLEVLRGSASMLFGRGSTGGVINQVSKSPQPYTQSQTELTVGSDDYYRLTGDFNVGTGEHAALRINAMVTDAHSPRNGPETHRKGIAPSYRWGIGERDEFQLSYFHLDYQDVPDYGFGWYQNRPSWFTKDTWYGRDSDYQDDRADALTLTHVHRFDHGGELKTAFRDGHYQRDLWATTARLTNANAVPTPTSAVTRGNQTRAGDDHHRFVQTDYSGQFAAFGLRNDLLAGGEWAREESNRYSYTFAAGNPSFNTVLGDPSHAPSPDNRTQQWQTSFTSTTLGTYVQDTLHLTEAWKLIGGLRFDRFDGDYERTAAAGGALSRTDDMWSKRVGVLYQPDARTSYHLSYGTSFNASGDLYQYDARTANTPPEKSRNIEVGSKWDRLDGDLSLRTALFRTEKYNERNTDAASASPTNYLLTAKRHTYGVEFEVAGRLSKAWEVFATYAYQIGRIDAGASTQVGSTPGLTPRHSGSVWTTYRVAPNWRVGGGFNGLSSVTPADAPAGSLLRAPGYVKADALVEYEAHPYTVKLNLLNLFDQEYADLVYRGHVVPGQARAAQLTVGLKF